MTKPNPFFGRKAENGGPKSKILDLYKNVLSKAFFSPVAFCAMAKQEVLCLSSKMQRAPPIRATRRALGGAPARIGLTCTSKALNRKFDPFLVQKWAKICPQSRLSSDFFAPKGRSKNREKSRLRRQVLPHLFFNFPPKAENCLFSRFIAKKVPKQSTFFAKRKM